MIQLSITFRKNYQPHISALPPLPVELPLAANLEYADEMTLARSLQNRMPVESYVGRIIADGSISYLIQQCINFAASQADLFIVRPEPVKGKQN